MTSHDITCAAGGWLTATPASLTVVQCPIARPMASAPASPVWRVETTAPGWFTVCCRSSGQVLVVSGQDDTLVVLAATAEGTRHHWRIIPYPERGSVVIISRMTGFVLTAGSPGAGRSAPVRLAAYHGAAAQHWSLTDPQGGTDAIQPE
jgi:Ricin-type beta-trefoil lectin domain-like